MAYLLSPKVAFSADEAVTGVMVRRILSGDRPAFYAGQSYGGTLEQYLQAAFYAATRLPQNAFTLRLPQVGLSLLTCSLIWLVGQRLLGSRGPAVFAALLYALGPWFNLVGTATSQGFYVAGQAVGLGTWWLALRLRTASSTVRATVRAPAVLGLVCGVAIWTSVTSVYYVVPALLWVLPIMGARLRCWAAYAVGAVVGAAPVAWQLLSRGALPLQTGVPVETSAVDRLHNLFGPVLREFLGVSYGHDQGGLPRPLQYAVAGVCLAAYSTALWRRRLGLGDLLRGSQSRRRPADLLLLVPPVVAATYVASPSVWYVGTPRYLLIVYPLLGLAFAASLPRLRVPAMTLATALTSVVTAALTVGFFAGQGRSWQVQEPQLQAVLAVLDQRGESTVIADYWTAMPLLYLADGAVRVGSSAGTVRFPDEQRAALAAPDPALLVRTTDGSAQRLEAALHQRGVSYRATTVDEYVIVDRLSARVGPADLG